MEISNLNKRFLAVCLAITLTAVSCKRDILMQENDSKSLKALNKKDNASENYYYYKGKKIFLKPNKEFIFVNYSKTASLNVETAQLRETAKGLKSFSGKSFVNQSADKTFYWKEMKLNNLSEIEYNDQVKKLQASPNIETVSPYFFDASGQKIGLSNFFYVKLKKEADLPLLEQKARENHLSIVEKNKFMPLWYTLTCTKETLKNALEISNLFFESGLFEYAEPDFLIENIASNASNTFFGNQWNLLNNGNYGGTYRADIYAKEAWVKKKGEGINVAVLDQGIELSHPDLLTNLHNLSYDTETMSSPSIVRGSHGTACAGIIGAVDNNIGIVGVAPKAKLMSVSNGLILSSTIKLELANGINWSWQNGADIISNSWGSNSLASSLIDEAISNALAQGRNGKGTIVVFATGNNNGSVNYPANSNPAILAVGAASMCDQRKAPTSCDKETGWGSNFGSELDVVAPGVLIPTTDLTGSGGYNSGSSQGSVLLPVDFSDANYTGTFNGTSSACPQVAGLAALVLSANPQLTGQQVRNIIESTARKSDKYVFSNSSSRVNGKWNNEYGYGMIDAEVAVRKALAVSNKAEFLINFSSQNSSATFKLEILRQGTAIATYNLNQDIQYKINLDAGTYQIRCTPTSSYHQEVLLTMYNSNNKPYSQIKTWGIDRESTTPVVQSVDVINGNLYDFNILHTFD
ncbi:MAG: S8 family serine peptidase [Sphingobacterium sp.]